MYVWTKCSSSSYICKMNIEKMYMKLTLKHMTYIYIYTQYLVPGTVTITATITMQCTNTLTHNNVKVQQRTSKNIPQQINMTMLILTSFSKRRTLMTFNSGIDKSLALERKVESRKRNFSLDLENLIVSISLSTLDFREW